MISLHALTDLQWKHLGRKLKSYVALTPNFPAKVLPVVFGKHVDASHALITQAGSYMSHLGDVTVGKGFLKSVN